MYTLEVEHLAHAYGDKIVLKNVNLKVPAGQTFGLLGPNGSGKSTAFSAIVGLLTPSGGTLKFDGQPIAFGGNRATRQKTGIVFQTPSIDPMLSARQNLMLAAKLFRIPKKEAKASIEAMLTEFDLRNEADQTIKEFSGGMRRKVDLIRALLPEPSLLILDEPSSGLDEHAFQQFWTIIEATQKKRQLTVLLTSHRPEEAERCHRIAVLYDGHILVEDTPGGLKARVSGDIITLETAEPAHVTHVIKSSLQIDAKYLDGEVVIEHPEGHTLIPRIVELFPLGTIRSVSMRRPSLGDVFLHLTGSRFRKTERGGNA